LKGGEMQMWGELLKIVLVAVITAVVDYMINQKDSVILSIS